MEQEDKTEAEAPANALIAARIRIVIEFMNANIHRRVTLTEMAEVTKLSANQLSRVFKAETGLPPLQYLTRLRMEKRRTFSRQLS
jgi:transcriptional regulator GlxA family with amidase domain